MRKTHLKPLPFSLGAALVLLTALCVLFTACGGLPATSVPTSVADPASAPVQQLSGVVKAVTIPSECIAKNILDEQDSHSFHIYLPASYESNPDKQYPVVYFLHGFGDSTSRLMASMKPSLEKAFAAGENEFILAAISGKNGAGGSFYVNSPIGGDWEDFIVQEVVDYMDSNYRTLADSASRSITGYSMGGYGAINIGLKHPDVFSSIVAFCPGIFAEGDLEKVFESWKSAPSVKKAYAQAFSPNPDVPNILGNIPEFSGAEVDNAIVEDWNNGYGNWAAKIDAYLALNTPLKGIQINYSDTDSYAWIPDGCKDFSRLLTERDIEHTLTEFSGGHVVPEDAVENFYAPFYKDTLAFQ